MSDVAFFPRGNHLKIESLRLDLYNLKKKFKTDKKKKKRTPKSLTEIYISQPYLPKHQNPLPPLSPLFLSRLSYTALCHYHHNSSSSSFDNWQWDSLLKSESRPSILSLILAQTIFTETPELPPPTTKRNNAKKKSDPRSATQASTRRSEVSSLSSNSFSL